MARANPPKSTCSNAGWNCRGLKVFFSEWNSSELVKNATSKGKKRELLSPNTFSLIHATDFADRYERQLVPLLRAGYIVLCDRYIFTAFGRDTVRGCPPEWVRGIYNFAAMPDLVFFFKASLEVSLHRILDGRPQLKYFEAGMDLHLSSDPYESFPHFPGPHSGGISGHEHGIQFPGH
jgi:dTMP kinase